MTNLLPIQVYLWSTYAQTRMDLDWPQRPLSAIMRVGQITIYSKQVTI